MDSQKVVPTHNYLYDGVSLNNKKEMKYQHIGTTKMNLENTSLSGRS